MQKWIAKQGISLGLLAFGALALGGCNSSSDSLCGAGKRTDYQGGAYCYYDQAITEEGFHCPDLLPHLFRLSGIRVCSKQNMLPDGFEQYLMSITGDGGTDSTDASNHDGASSDATIVQDANVSSDSGPRSCGPVNLCGTNELCVTQYPGACNPNPPSTVGCTQVSAGGSPCYLCPTHECKTLPTNCSDCSCISTNTRALCFGEGQCTSRSTDFFQLTCYGI